MRSHGSIDYALGFFIDGSIASPSLATTIRFASDAPDGSYFQRNDGGWIRSVVDRPRRWQLPPKIAGDLVVYSSKAPDDTEDLLIRRLGCAP